MSRITFVAWALLAACSKDDASPTPADVATDASGGTSGNAGGGGAFMAGSGGRSGTAGRGEPGAGGTRGGGSGMGGATPTPSDASTDGSSADASHTGDSSQDDTADSTPFLDAGPADTSTDIRNVSDGTSDASDGGSVGCAAMMTLPVPDDPSVRGPWVVGVRTVTIGRLTVEILYPAEPGSEQGKEETTYDVRAWLPERERSKVPDANSPAVKPIGGKLFRDLPLDTGHGPYPVVIFVHGTASFRIASGSTMTQWASRGFVVLAADYPGMFLADALAGTLECLLPTTGAQDVPGDIATQTQALATASGNLAFLAGHIDMTRLGLSGHSQGACITATLSTNANVRIVIPMAGSAPVTPSSSLRSLMYIGGIDDKVIGYNAPLLGNVVCPLFSSSGTGAYQASPGPPGVTKRLVGITGGGHLVMTDLCQKNALGRNAIEEAQADGVCGINSAVIIGLPALFDCGTLDMTTGIKAVNYASTAALEEALMCKDRSVQFASLKANVPSIGDFQEAK
jgi:dienelactone hydrolase